MKVQDLIGEVAKRHNVLVDPSDPIFVAVTLNELLLAEHVANVAKVEAALERAENALAVAASRHLEKTRWTATTLVANSSAALSEQLKAAGPALRSQLQQAVREMVLTAGAAAAEAVRQRRASQRAAAVAIASACAVFLTALATWLARP
jgi:hypothetical protein